MAPDVGRMVRNAARAGVPPGADRLAVQAGPQDPDNPSAFESELAIALQAGVGEPLRQIIATSRELGSWRSGCRETGSRQPAERAGQPCG